MDCGKQRVTALLYTVSSLDKARDGLRAVHREAAYRPPDRPAADARVG